MKDKDIQEILDNLGKHVSLLAEENRTCKTRDQAGKGLIKLIGSYVTKKDWVKIFNSTDNQFIKEIMIDWGKDIFPEDFVK